MSGSRSAWVLAFLLPLLLLLISSVDAAPKIGWKRIQVDSTFRSEGVTVADVNRDGKIDVLAGDVWYEAPKWKMHEIRPVGEYDFAKGYSNSFTNFAYDLNGDGWDDYIVVGFPGAACFWYENPRNQQGHWVEREVWHSACNESPNFGDLTGDGRPELILGADEQLGFLPIPTDNAVKKKWSFYPVSTKGDPKTNGSFRFYHGLGHADLNGDGRTDLLIPHGWYEAPEDRTSAPWTFHSFSLSKDSKSEPLRAANLHAEDFDLDGDQDIVMSSAHDFGIWWFENLGGAENTKFRYHLIDESFSQTHALEFADIDGDGDKDLVTGKRFYAHNGHDPGGKDLVVMYWIEVERKKGAPPEFRLHEIEEGRNTGIGTQFLVRDVTGDGRYDIILSNKKGVNVLVQERSAVSGEK